MNVNSEVGHPARVDIELGACDVGGHLSPAAAEHREPHPYDWRRCRRWVSTERDPSPPRDANRDAPKSADSGRDRQTP